MNDLTLPIQSNTKTAKPKSAKRLAETKELTHQDWLAVRNTGIGGSDAAAACGLNPYIVKPIL